MVEAHRDTDHVVVFDVPLLVDVGLQDAFDVVVVVSAPPDQQLLRVMRDRTMSEQDASARIAAQVSSAERESAADVVIPNDGDIEELERRVEALWADLRRRATRS
jgi:dephospho-CoA kinase